MNNYKLDSPHLLLEPTSLPTKNVLERLIRQNQSYKVGLQHALNIEKLEVNIRNRFNVLHKINRIDYLQPLEDFHSSFDVELSFSWLNWRIMDMLEAGQI